MWFNTGIFYSWFQLVVIFFKTKFFCNCKTDHIGSCPGWRNGNALARPGSIPGQDRIFLFQISKLANRGHSSDKQIFTDHIYLFSFAYSTGAQEWHIVSVLGVVTSPTTVDHYVSMSDLRLLRTAKNWPPRPQHTVYTNKRLECKGEVHSSSLNK